MRIPRDNIARLLAACVMTVCLAACDGGGGATAGGGGGIVGTGKQVVASGEVNGFGSVIVNGIEFSRSTDPDVSPASIMLAFDNISTAREDALRTGMVVAVSGSYDTASGKGSYTRIAFSPEVRGRLDSGSVNAAAGTCTVLGRTIQASAATIFDGLIDMNDLAGLQNQNLELEVSGYLDTQGKVQASRIAVKSTGFTTGTVQLKGMVTALGNGSFTIGGVNVATTNAVFVNMEASDLALPGLVVEVRGTLTGATLSNARIERKNSTSGVPTGDTMRIKGVAAGPLIEGSFVMAGPDGVLTVTTDGATFLRGKNSADDSIVAAGERLEIEGTVQADGSVAARKVETETHRTVRLEGDLAAVDLSSGTLTLNGVTVATDKSTTFRDNRKTTKTANLTLSGLSPGEHLRMDGHLEGNGRVLASQVQRFDAYAVTILQGPVAAVDLANQQLTILGVTVTIRPGAEMAKGEATYADFASFVARLAPGSTVVKAKGTSAGSNFSASSLEIEQ